MKKYKALIFDFDYTLVNSDKGIMESFHYVFEKNHITGIPDDLVRMTVGFHLRDAFMMLIPGLTLEDTDRLRADFKEAAVKVMTKGSRLFPDTLGCLNLFYENGIPMGIFSSNEQVRIREALSFYGLEDYFEHIAGSSDVQKPKPDPEGLLLLGEKLGLEVDEILYVGDSYLDALAAAGCGMDFAGVATGTTPTLKLKEYPHVFVGRNLKEFKEWYEAT